MSWKDPLVNANIDCNLEHLRPQQEEALSWALEHDEPYLLANIPTGGGKSLLNVLYAASLGRTFTYCTHTIRLQKQLVSTFPNIPVMMGRANFPCWIGNDIYGKEVMADQGICVLGDWCPHTGKAGPEGEEAAQQCPYYEMQGVCMSSPHRIANYALMLSYFPLKIKHNSEVILADEAHIIERAVLNSTEIFLSSRTAARFGIKLPHGMLELSKWALFAKDALKTLPARKKNEPPDFGLKTLGETLGTVANFTEKAEGKWIVVEKESGYGFQPIWGRDFVLPSLLNHGLDGSFSNGSPSRLFATSATLMGAEYIAETLGLPDDKWAYLDLPSTFPPENRPVNYAPVVKMNSGNLQPGYNAEREKMQSAIDNIIERYVMNGTPWGIIHTVSNRYRDYILTESRWQGIMTIDPDQHVARVEGGEGSVLVAANIAEGWDGFDDRCRFIIMPKVPFPDLGDVRTRIRKEEDARSYDHATLVAVVQGAGRGVRHTEDKCDTFILDASWDFLYTRRKDWLPQSFKNAYHHRVRIEGVN